MKVLSGIIGPIVLLLTKTCLDGGGGKMEEMTNSPDKDLIRVLVLDRNFAWRIHDRSD